MSHPSTEPGDDHAADAQIQITERANFRALIQRCLERFVEERSQHKLVRAATQLVSLHGLTSELIELDPAFADEWAEIRGGRLVDWIRNNPVELSWRDLDLGFEAFVRLLGRFGMGLQAELGDPVDQRQHRATDVLARHTQHPPPALELEGEE